MSRQKWFFLWFYSFLLFSLVAKEKNEPVWTLAATRFSLINVPELYASYADGVPTMLSTFCVAPSMRRLVRVDEKRRQYLVETTRKKLQLIKERAALIKERDTVYFSMLEAEEQKTKIILFNKDIEAKEKEIAKIQEKLDTQEKLMSQEKRDSKNESELFSDELMPVRFWKDGQSLFEQPKHTNLEPALQAEKIDAVIEGSIENLAGYMYITVSLHSSLPGMPAVTFSEAGAYHSVEAVTRSLAKQIITAITNTTPIKVELSVEPAHANVFLGDREIPVTEKEFYVHEGTYRIEAAAADYESAYKTIEARTGNQYRLQIKLKPEKKVTIGFPFTAPATDVFLHTQYFGKNPLEATLPLKKQTVFTFSYNDVKTYILVHPESFVSKDKSTYALQASLNKVRTKTLIEKRRATLYWSLAAFYISLPVSLMLQGITADMASAIASQKIPSSGSYTALSITTRVMQGITAGLGINYAVQLGLYLYAADQSIPKEAYLVQ